MGVRQKNLESGEEAKLRLGPDEKGGLAGRGGQVGKGQTEGEMSVTSS